MSLTLSNVPGSSNKWVELFTISILELFSILHFLINLKVKSKTTLSLFPIINKNGIFFRFSNRLFWKVGIDKTKSGLPPRDTIVFITVDVRDEVEIHSQWLSLKIVLL